MFFASPPRPFMLMGDVCTRNLSVLPPRLHGRARPLDPDEPRRIAEAVRAAGVCSPWSSLQLIRDDLPDGGAAHFAATANAIKSTSRTHASKCWCRTSRASIRAWRRGGGVTGRSIYNHNIETVAESLSLNAGRAAAMNCRSTFGSCLNIPLASTGVSC